MDIKTEKNEVAIQLSGVKKQYKLGQIGGGTLQGDIQSWWARIRGKEDPNTKIGQEQRLVGQSFMALNGIDLTIYKGEALGIIGSNGAGKSTLLKLLSQVTAPSAGTIDINGRIASMLEVGTGFNGEMTGRENIYMNGAILGMTKAEIDAKMEDIIEFSEVREFIDTPVKRYSSGMYVKLAFSVAAHLDSEIMIMDEVLAVGDMTFQKKCLDKMRDIAKKEGRTVLYVSHNMNTIRQLCDRCIVLDKGKLVFEGDVETAIEVYMGDYVEKKIEYVYSRAQRINPRSNNSFIITGLKMKNVVSPMYRSGDIINLELECATSKTWENVKIRFELHSHDGVKIGSMLSADDVTFKIGEKTNVTIKMDTTHLTPGKYIADIVAYQDNQFGTEQFIDGVYPGFIFQISDERFENDNIIWLHQHWGHIRLHDIKLSIHN